MNITKEGELMTIDQQKEDLDKAVKLLEESVYCLNLMKNKKYHGPDFESSYELASAIDKFLNKMK